MTISTACKVPEARLMLTSEFEGVNMEVQRTGSEDGTVMESLTKLMRLVFTLRDQKDLFASSNDPQFSAHILVRHSKDFLEVTPVYERKLPNNPPYSPAELLAGRLMSEFVECKRHG